MNILRIVDGESNQPGKTSTWEIWGIASALIETINSPGGRQMSKFAFWQIARPDQYLNIRKISARGITRSRRLSDEDSESEQWMNSRSRSVDAHLIVAPFGADRRFSSPSNFFYTQLSFQRWKGHRVLPIHSQCNASASPTPTNQISRIQQDSVDPGGARILWDKIPNAWRRHADLR
jgi:hypothetical protein